MAGILALRSRTIREIAEQLDLPVWYNSYQVPLKTDIVIRWGSTASIPLAGKVINSAEAISKASNKPLCHSLLEQAGVPVPHSGFDKFPCIGRRAKHKEGRAFWICWNFKDVQRAMRQGAEYFREFYPKQNEARIHIANGKCILYSEKEGRKEGRMCWSHRKTGFTFRHVPKETGERQRDLIELAKEAVKVIGLDFAGVDILYNPSKEGYPEAVVCEINSMPGLSPLGVKAYVKYFQRVLEGDRVTEWQYKKPLKSNWEEQMSSFL